MKKINFIKKVTPLSADTFNQMQNNIEEEFSQVNSQLAQKASKDEVTNVMTPKGTIAYASLPVSGNEVGWYYYCPDGDGTHGAGNYVWNGTEWYFGGTGDEGYNVLKKDIDQYRLGIYSDYGRMAMSKGYKRWIATNWETGVVSNGIDMYNTSYVRTPANNLIPCNNGLHLELLDNNINVRFLYYNDSGDYVTQSSWLTVSQDLKPSYPYCRLLTKHNSETELKPIDVMPYVFISYLDESILTLEKISNRLNAEEVKNKWEYQDVIANYLYPYIEINTKVEKGQRILVRVNKYTGQKLNKCSLVGVDDSDNVINIINSLEIGISYNVMLTQSFAKLRVIFNLTEEEIANASVVFSNLSDFTLVSRAFNKYNIDLSGKYISILGVSIDTYSGWIPNGNITYYSSANLSNVSDTWWSKVIEYTNANLLVNNSWSGATASTALGLESSGVERCLNLDDGVNVPDIILVGAFGFNDWVHSSLGEYSWSANLPGVDINLSDDANYEEYKSVIETYAGAMSTIFYRIQEKYPKAKILAMDMYNYSRAGQHNPTGNSESQNLLSYNKVLYEVCDAFGVKIIPISKCGINAINSANYTVEGSSSSTHLHPNANGHDLICETVLNALN